MDTETFWKLIDESRVAGHGDVIEQANFIIGKLLQLPETEIIAFERIFWQLMAEAYDANLWDAAHIIGCGCSDDGFEDFRAWLIAQGKERYEMALTDPESLVDLVNVDQFAQEGALLYVAYEAYSQKTGHDTPVLPRSLTHPTLKGTHWPVEKKKDRFPILTAKFGDCSERFDKMI
ncbi:MAG: DUF4240 domain-containing protein [Anaerolineae bacterium]|nr:DUF4240 domain-containing protein [Anaerolineae bacterium]